MEFSDLGLSPEVLRAIDDAGYKTPTPIQEQAIPIIFMGRDVLGCAQTGTGKTASFTLPMIDMLAAGRARARMPRSLILEPTRELATQVAESFERYGKHHKLNMALLIGGESFADQLKKLDRGVDVLVATPGRLLDLFERGKILLSDTKILVIDEADRMLDMGFIPDVERIVSMLPKLRQTLFFSATMPPEIKRLADAFLMNPKEISVSPPTSPAAMVIQHLAVIDELDKREALRHLLRAESVRSALIFCNRKRDVDILQRSLAKHKFDAAALHGDMAQAKRTETLDRFRAGAVKILVASDVAARGLDVIGLTHVFNFDVPIHAEDYIHRIGRTGRAGREGLSYTLATPDDGAFVTAIERLIGKAIPRIDVEGLPSVEFAASDGRPRRGRHTARREEPRARRPRRIPEAPAASARPAQHAPEPQPAIAPAPAPQPAPRHVNAGRPRPVERQATTPRPAPTPASKPAPMVETEPVGSVVAFGEHMPAFLRRPVPKPRPTENDAA